MRQRNDPGGVRSGGVRLTRRGRVVVIVALAALVLAFCLAVTRQAGQADTTAGRPEARVVLVRPGETLWEIAQRHEPRADPRRTVWRIRALNDLRSPIVQPGQRLLLPP